MSAAQARSVEVAKLFMNQAKKQLISGQTALMVAAAQNSAEICTLLQCELGMKTISGLTASMLGAVHGSVDALKITIEKEAKMESDAGETALVSAVTAGKMNSVEYLASGPDNIITSRG